MVRTLLIGIDGSIDVVDKGDGLAASQALVGGDIETILWDGSTWCLMGNEWGKIHAQEKKEGFENNEIGRRFVADMKEAPLDQIVSLHGPMFLIGINDEGDFIDVPDEAEACIRKHEGATAPEFFTEIQPPVIETFSSMEELEKYRTQIGL